MDSDELKEKLGIDDDTTYRINPNTGIVQKEGLVSWKDTDIRVEPDTGNIQESNIIGWKNTGTRINPRSGVVQEEGFIAHRDTDTKVNPETGVIQHRGFLGWENTDERIDPDTGKHQVQGILGWRDSGGGGGGGGGGFSIGSGGSSSSSGLFSGEYGWVAWLLLIAGIIYAIYWLIVHFWVLLIVIPVGGGFIYGFYSTLVKNGKPISAFIGIVLIIAAALGGIWLSYLAINNSFSSNSTVTSQALSQPASSVSAAPQNQATIEAHPGFVERTSSPNPALAAEKNWVLVLADELDIYQEDPAGLQLVGSYQDQGNDIQEFATVYYGDYLEYVSYHETSTQFSLSSRPCCLASLKVKTDDGRIGWIIAKWQRPFVSTVELARIVPDKSVRDARVSFPSISGKWFGSLKGILSGKETKFWLFFQQDGVFFHGTGIVKTGSEEGKVTEVGGSIFEDYVYFVARFTSGEGYLTFSGYISSGGRTISLSVLGEMGIPLGDFDISHQD